MWKKPQPFIVQDKYFMMAKKAGYRARSAFKLLEIQEKFRLIQPWQTVLDIGAAPWSFLQVTAPIVGEKGKVMGIDLQKIDQLGYGHVKLFQADVFDAETVAKHIESLWISQFDLIISDIAPATTGMTGVDQYRSVELNLAILTVAEKFLKTGGNLLLKVFVGEDVNDLVFPLKRAFKELKRTKPRACRDRSFEEYFVCLGKK